MFINMFVSTFVVIMFMVAAGQIIAKAVSKK